MSVRVGINGFGRMGRALYRVARESDLGIEVVAVNDLGSPATMAALLARDSVYGRFHEQVKAGDGELLVGGDIVHCTSQPDPGRLHWGAWDVEVVVECTGRLRTRDDAALHLGAGAKRVVVSAPCTDADATIVLGVNDDALDSSHQVISNASCTTNCLAPMIKVLEDSFGLESGLVTTVHAYTGDQNLVDAPHKDLRRARAAALNIVPTATGAARTTAKVVAGMDDRLDGRALRVPVADGSITDLVAVLAAPAGVDQVNEAFRAAADGDLAGIIDYSEEPLVSSDIVGSSASCVFDAGLTMARGPLVKVFGWYDNEWGYANRLAELTAIVGETLLAAV